MESRKMQPSPKNNDPKREDPKNEDQQRKDQPPAEPEIGGREFGQVIEPMQAQMASENEGLADKPKETDSKTKKKEKAA